MRVSVRSLEPSLLEHVVAVSVAVLSYAVPSPIIVFFSPSGPLTSALTYAPLLQLSTKKQQKGSKGAIETEPKMKQNRSYCVARRKKHGS